MNTLSDLLAGRRDDVDLDHAALMLATVEHPRLDIGRYLEEIDRKAEELSRRVTGFTDGRGFIHAANTYLFQELGFHGNTDDYYNPANSCLNDVLTHRRGIPISLSVLYIEISRRLSRPIAGIGLPGHFVVRYDDGAFSTYIDPFHAGRLLDAGDCLEIAKTASGGAVRLNGPVLAPVGTQQIIARMINNLRGIYFSRRAHRKALQILNVLIDAHPLSPDEYKQRGLVYMQMERMHDARADFAHYLELAPQAADRDEIAKQISSIARWQVGLN